MSRIPVGLLLSQQHLMVITDACGPTPWRQPLQGCSMQPLLANSTLQLAERFVTAVQCWHCSRPPPPLPAFVTPSWQ